MEGMEELAEEENRPSEGWPLGGWMQGVVGRALAVGSWGV